VRDLDTMRVLLRDRREARSTMAAD